MIDPQTLGQQYNLGNFKKKYGRPFFLSPWLQFVPAAAILVLIAVGLLTFWFTSSKAPVLPDVPMAIMAGLGWLGFFCIFPLSFILKYRKRAQYVFIYKAGLIYEDRKSRQVILWQDIQQMQYGVDENGQATSITITDAHGTSLRLNGFAKMEELRKSIEEEVANRLFPIALKVYQANQVVTFESLEVSSQGISYKSKWLPWSELDIHTIGSQVRISKKGERPFWAILMIPNVEVFRRLIHHITGTYPKKIS